jgi:stage II sporulation protein Q
MIMREEKPKAPSQKNKSAQKRNWFWPAVYSGIAIVFVGMIWGYSAFIKEDSPGLLANDDPSKDPVLVETNAPKETLKYPFNEAYFDEVTILQGYYDMKADESDREKALLVFNQTYSTNTGISLSIGGQPFEVVAAMSGTVEDIIKDVFMGDEIVLLHADGMKTVYGSVKEILVKIGEEVDQGQSIATASQNDWNPTAGIHLHFELWKDGETVNPGSMLGF